MIGCKTAFSIEHPCVGEVYISVLDMVLKGEFRGLSDLKEGAVLQNCDLCVRDAPCMLAKREDETVHVFSSCRNMASRMIDSRAWYDRRLSKVKISCTWNISDRSRRPQKKRTEWTISREYSNPIDYLRAKYLRANRVEAIHSGTMSNAVNISADAYFLEMGDWQTLRLGDINETVAALELVQYGVHKQNILESITRYQCHR